MTEQERQHAEMVSKLAKNGAEILAGTTPQQAHLQHMLMGITGEVGELVDAVKKHIIYRRPLDLENVVEELGDLEFYLQGLRESLQINRERTLQYNMEKLAVRYKDYLYSDQQAQARADKQEVAG